MKRMFGTAILVVLAALTVVALQQTDTPANTHSELGRIETTQN